MSDIQISLPPFSRIEVFCEADFYGATSLIATELGKKTRPISTCSWKHGWGGLSPLRYPEQLVSSGSKKSRVLVHTEQQREFLMSEGYSDVHTVGMPFCYTQGIAEVFARKKQSLLVMPPHITRHLSPRLNENEYVDAVRLIRTDFENIVICISGECERQGRWRANFEKAGFPVIVGADVFDANALIRMYRIFRSFEFVTSPNLGSHIVYAALCGCRVSIFGPHIIIDGNDLTREPYYQRFPRMLELMHSIETKIFKNELKSRFDCNPNKAKFHIEWAVKESGLDNMRDLVDLSNLLGWGCIAQLKRQSNSKLRNLMKLVRQ